ncbi:unnamed protein product [Psylliodes chrysocephalus]|uniref:C2H2-type domain-containing protein n=1 Tax=Psylliodes chrysocephalus TaxID=3402493 RepID=A0A9P0CWE1_9CUCU|nr:unnamed protein product [Psylliodes chrysocephala]
MIVLKKHLAQDCGKESKYSCDLFLERHECKNCNKHYKNVGDLRRHQRLECGKEPTNECTLCGYKTYRAPDLKLHYLRPRFACSKCLRTYKYKYDLRKHVLNECGKEPTRECTMCDFKTFRTNGLNIHYKSVVFCMQCGRSYKNLQTLRMHVKLDCGPVACPKCDKLYKNANSMNSHFYQDCGRAKRFSCSFCPACFKRKQQLLVHMSRKHQYYMP